LLPYPVEKIFALINDVESYPQYMDGCVGAEILHQEPGLMEARLDLSKAGISQSFTTRNSLEAPVSVKMQLLEGPFSQFSGHWQLQPLNEQACKITLALNFQVSSKLLNVAAKALFNPMADNLVDAVVKRAKAVC
jgi:ribosome-associated toxin RatA of RatAB toxin-antitoxin module